MQDWGLYSFCDSPPSGEQARLLSYWCEVWGTPAWAPWILVLCCHFNTLFTCMLKSLLKKINFSFCLFFFFFFKPWCCLTAYFFFQKMCLFWTTKGKDSLGDRLIKNPLFWERGTPEHFHASLVSTDQEHTKFCYLVLDSDHCLMLFRCVRTPAVPLYCVGVFLGEKCLSDPSLQSINTMKHGNL